MKQKKKKPCSVACAKHRWFVVFFFFRSFCIDAWPSKIPSLGSNEVHSNKKWKTRAKIDSHKLIPSHRHCIYNRIKQQTKMKEKQQTYNQSNAIYWFSSCFIMIIQHSVLNTHSLRFFFRNVINVISTQLLFPFAFAYLLANGLDISRIYEWIDIFASANRLIFGLNPEIKID